MSPPGRPKGEYRSAQHEGAPLTAPLLVVMGVCGCGKSTVAAGLAQALGLDFLEGDTLHPPANVARMAAGQALGDDDRRGWLQAIAGRLSNAGAASRGLVVSCSALKRSYRDVLRSGAPGVRFVYLHGSRAVLEQRLAARSGHYMPAALLQSQLDTLQPPQPDEQAIELNIGQEAAALVRQALQRLGVPAMSFTKTVLFTDGDGRARFRQEAVPLNEGKPAARLSTLMPSTGYQLRMSPVGFRSEFHCTETPQWVFILGGQMEIGLQDGSSHSFKPGEHFYSADTLPAGAVFDPKIHGHWSRQLGDEPLATLFLRG